jgi:hypothetical protein
MILKQTTGCVCNSLTVDDVEEIDLTEEQRKEVILKISEYIANQMKTDDLNCFLQYFIDFFGEEKCISNEPCDCCGDWVYETTLIV